MNRFRIVPVLALAFVLAGCSWFGSSDSDKISAKELAKAIPVLAGVQKIQPDAALAGTKPEVPAPVANKDWPQPGYDVSHMMPDAALAANPQKIWSSDIGSGSDDNYKLLAQPVVAQGLVYTMDAEGGITAFDAATGDQKWDFDTTPEDADNSAMGGGLAYAGGTLYATTGFGEVIALNAASGHVEWRHKLGNPVRGAPTVAGGQVYALSIDDDVHALDVHDGNELWHHNGIDEVATLMGASSPALAGDSVIVAYASGEVYDLRPENGRADWNYTLSMPTHMGALPAIADIRGLPVVDHGDVFAASHSGRMAAIDQRTGGRVWEADIGGVDTPLVAGDTVFLIADDHQLVALTRDSGRVIWAQTLQSLSDPTDHDSDRVFWVGPVLAGGKLWLANSLGQVRSFSAADGHQLGKIHLSEPIFIAPVVANGIMYVVLNDGTLVALR